MQYRYSHFLIRYFSELKKLKVYSTIYVAYLITRQHYTTSWNVVYWEPGLRIEKEFFMIYAQYIILVTTKLLKVKI